MVSLGMFASRAARTADRNRALCSGSPPPLRAATVTSRMSLVKSTPLVAPIASFLRLIFVHRLWPDMTTPDPALDAGAFQLARAPRGRQRQGGPPGDPPTRPHFHAEAPCSSMLAPPGQVAALPGNVDSSTPASLERIRGGGEASDSPRPSKRCVDARKSSVPADRAYREASKD